MHHMELARFDERVETCAQAGVTIYNLNAQRTNCDSDVWESWLDNFDPDAGFDAPFYQGFPPAAHKPNRNQRMAMLEIKKMGIDPVGYSLDQAR